MPQHRHASADPVGQMISQGASTPDDVMRGEVALYVTDMCSELAKMARASGLNLLAYFLDMAMAEGRSEAEKAQAGYVQPRE